MSTTTTVATRDVSDTGAIFEALESRLQHARSAHQDFFEGVEQQLTALRQGVEERLADTTAQDLLTALEAEKAQLAEELEALRATAATEATRAGDLEQQLKAAHAAGEAHDAQQQELRREVERLGAELKAKQAKMQESTLREDVLKQSLDELEMQRSHLQQQVEAAPAPEALKVLQEELREERAKVSALEEQLQSETARGTKAMLAGQLAGALQEAEQANEEIRRLRRQVEDLKSAPAPTPAADDSSKAELAELRDEVARLRTQLAAASVFAAAADNTATSVGADAETERVREVIARQANGNKRSLGEILVEAGILTQEQVNECLEHQKKNPQQHIGAILVEKKLSSEEAVAYALAYQCGVEYVRLDSASISPEAVALLNERLAQKHSCVPIATNGETLKLAMANPVDLVAIEDIERATGLKVEVLVSTEAEIKAALQKYY